MQAVLPYREGAAEGARAALERLAELTLEAFPATLVPSPLVTELDALAREAGLDLPLVEELAADIFMGRFSRKFLDAAKAAAPLLRGSLYERYYRIDYDEVARLGGADAFSALCRARAGGGGDGWSVAANGTVVEQAQILTTHDLAPLAQLADLDWAALARRCFEAVVALEERLAGQDRPLRTVKNLAYAWRQMVFFLSLAPEEARAEVLDRVREAAPPRLAAAVAGLEDPGSAAPLLGWTVGEHPLLAGAPRRGD